MYNFMFLLVNLTLNTLFGILFFTEIFGILIAICLFTRLQQIDDYIRICLQTSWMTVRSFTRFLNENQRSLAILRDINAIYGNFLFVFFLINTPLNATILMTFTLGSISLTTETRLFFIIILVGQSIFLVAVALYPIVLSLKLHEPARKLLALPAKSMNRWPLLCRLKFTNYLEQFHTKNLYTINLGQFGGKITYQSTGRHLFFYFKLLIFAYKLVAK